MTDHSAFIKCCVAYTSGGDPGGGFDLRGQLPCQRQRARVATYDSVPGDLPAALGRMGKIHRAAGGTGN